MTTQQTVNNLIHVIKTYSYTDNEIYIETFNTREELKFGLHEMLEREDNELSYEELENLLMSGLHNDGYDTIEIYELKGIVSEKQIAKIEYAKNNFLSDELKNNFGQLMNDLESKVEEYDELISVGNVTIRKNFSKDTTSQDLIERVEEIVVAIVDESEKIIATRTVKEVLEGNDLQLGWNEKFKEVTLVDLQAEDNEQLLGGNVVDILEELDTYTEYFHYKHGEDESRVVFPK